MKRFSTTSIRYRLIGGFLFCALLTGFSGGTGIYSLKQIMARMSQSSDAVFSNIDNQNAQINTLIPIRTVITGITNAKTTKDLDKINETIQSGLDSVSKSNEAFHTILSGTQELFPHKREQLTAVRELTNMLNVNIDILDKISKSILLSVRESEDRVYKIVENNLLNIKKRFIGVVEGRRAEKLSQAQIELLFKRSGMNEMMDEVLMSSGMSISSLSAAHRIQSKSYEQLAIVKTIFTVNDHETLDKTEKDIEFIQGKINSDLVELPENETTTEIYDLYQRFTTLGKEMIKKKHQEIDVSNDLNQVTLSILDEMRRIEKNILSDGEAMKEEVSEIMKSSAGMISGWQYVQIVLVLVSILIAATIGGIVAGSISRPINKIISMLKDIARGDGDLTMRLDESKRDEMGIMAGWFNQFVSKIQGIIKDIASDSFILNTSSGALESLSSRISNEISEFNDKSGNVLSRSQGIGEDIAAIDKSIAEISEDIYAVTDASKEMIHTIGDIADRTANTRQMTGDAVAQAVKTTSRVGELEKQMASIGQITEVINDISSQINLLALNATIESARAGQAGKGFAVVANEIKELASQTSEATARINEQIREAQLTTNDTVDDIERISDTIKNVDDVVQKMASAIEQQSVTTNDISNSISHVSNGISQIIEKTGKNATMVQEIALDMSEINRSAEGMATGSNDIDTNARELATLSNRLKTHVDQFRI